MARKLIRWGDVRNYYESSTGVSKDLAVSRTASKYNVDPRTVERKIKEEGWIVGSRTHANVIDFKAPSPLLAGRVPDSPADHLALVSHAIYGFGMALKDLEQHDLSKAAAGANAMCKLIELHRTIQPPTATMLADAAIAAGISPQEFIEALGMQWQQRA